MNAAYRPKLVSAIANFYAYAESRHPDQSPFETKLFAEDAYLYKLYKEMVEIARHAGCVTDDFLDTLANDVARELRRRKKITSTPSVEGFGYARGAKIITLEKV